MAEITGKSMRPLFEGKASFGSEAQWKGDWKIIKMNQIWEGAENWTLVNIAHDPQETKDLESEHPDILAALIKDYEEYATQVGVIQE